MKIKSKLFYGTCQQLRLFQSKFHEEKIMKLNIGDRIKYDNSIYAVVAIIWSTVYLRTVNDDSADYDYKMQEIYKTYKDIEFLGDSVK